MPQPRSARRLRRLGRHLLPPGDPRPGAAPAAAPAAAAHHPDVTIEGQQVVATALRGAAPSAHETQRLIDTLLHGAGYFIAKAVLSPTLAEHCRTVALARGELPPYENGLKRRVMGLMDLDPEAFSSVLLETETQLGPVLRTVMGDGAFLNSYHSFSLYPERPAAGTAPYRSSSAAQLSDFGPEELRRDFQCVDESAPGGGLWRRRPRLSPQQVYDAWAHDAHHDRTFPSIQTIWMLSEFNGLNGGTRLLKDTWRERRQPKPSSDDTERFASECIPVTGEPGDVLVYVGQTWHAEGVNVTESPRVGLLGQWSDASDRRVTVSFI